MEELAQNYEEKLVESKMLARKLSAENMRMIEDIRDRDYKIDELQAKLDHQADYLELQNECSRLSDDN